MNANPPTYSGGPAEGPDPDTLTVSERDLLPFVGREEEIEYINAFVRGALASDRLSTLWVAGEAGIGKSRLIDQVSEDLYPSVILIRCRFYPNASLSIQSVLASAVLETTRRYGITTSLTLPSTLPSTLAEIRGIIRRYPTILVFEDVHLIDEETAREFASIVHGLEHEPTGMICTTRPSNGQIYGTVLPFMVATLSLSPLKLTDLAEMATIFGYRKDQFPNLLRLIMQKTHGFPLAVWSIFRRIQSDPEGFSRSPVRETRKIARDLSDSVLQSISRGVSEEDLACARQLSVLGEIFSSRAARMLVEDAEQVIVNLRHAGLLTPVPGSPPPIVGTISVDEPDQDWLYCFSHSLLHDTLFEEAPEADERLLALLESDLPLFSTTPFTHAIDAEQIVEQKENLNRLLKRQRLIVESLISSPAWSAGVRVFRVAQKMLAEQSDQFTEEEYRDHRLEMLLLECNLFNAFTTRPEFQRPLQELATLTADPQTRSDAQRRMKVLKYNLFSTSETWHLNTESTMEETALLVERFPDLLLDPAHIELLKSLGGAVRSVNSPEASSRFRVTLGQILDAAENLDDRRTELLVLRDVAPTILPAFHTEEELKDRRELAGRIMETFRNQEPSGGILATWVRFLEIIGHARAANESLQKWMPPILSGYDISIEVSLRLQRLNVDSALGLPIEKIARRARMLIVEFENLQPPPKEGNTPSFARVAVAMHLIMIGVMRGDVRRGYHLAVEMCNGVEESISGYMVLERSTLLGDIEALHRLSEERTPSRLFDEVLLWLREKKRGNVDRAVAQLIDNLHQPVLRRQDLLSIRITIAFFELFSTEWSQGVTREKQQEEIESGLRAGLRWLGERDAHGYTETFARTAREYLSDEEIAKLLGGTMLSTEGVDNEGVDNESEEPERSEKPVSFESDILTPLTFSEPALYIEVLGTFATKKKGEKLKKTRGARMKRFIGMLAAQEMLASELTLAQFRRSATELEDPEESANYLRILTSRLRKSIGSEMILTDGEHPPRFDRELVGLDIADVADTIRRAGSAAEQNNGATAILLIEEVLKRNEAGVPFADQQGEFFDAARQELKDRLRQAVNRTVDLLRREGSTEKADALLARLIESR